MCGRFTLTIDVRQLAGTLMSPQTIEVPGSISTEPRYNVAPTQDVAAVLNNGNLRLEMLRWGLIPSWAKEESVGARMINARAETLAEKPSFKRLLHGRRCLILADGFYEWRQEPGTKTKIPQYISLKDQEPFTLAGLWDSWKAPDGRQLQTCTIITTQPNELVANIHNRMPVILPRAARDLWLDPALKDEQALLPLLVPYDAEAMTARPVSRRVNDPRYDSAELIA
jgi:putative SOS response-associated peptidase YedK